MNPINSQLHTFPAVAGGIGNKEVYHVYAAKRNRIGNGNGMGRFRSIAREVHPAAGYRHQRS
jgi:hypothetical protein